MKATPVRSKKTKEDFVKYLEDHPQERFWQSIRNFAKVPFVIISDDIDLDFMTDTFYYEELDK